VTLALTNQKQEKPSEGRTLFGALFRGARYVENSKLGEKLEFRGGNRRLKYQGLERRVRDDESDPSKRAIAESGWRRTKPKNSCWLNSETGDEREERNWMWRPIPKVRGYQGEGGGHKGSAERGNSKKENAAGTETARGT